MNKSSQHLRELMRVLVRDLGVLKKEDVACCGVTIAQCHALVEIGRAGQFSLIDLAVLLGLDKSTMSRTINNLVKAKLVRRETDPNNRRYVIIQLTEEGKKIVKNIEESMDAYYHEVFSEISVDKRAQVLESLEILIRAVEKNSQNQG